MEPENQKFDRRRLAPIGLWVALLSALAAAGLYIVQREWNLPLQISIALVVMGLALFTILDPERVRRTLTGRQARYGSNLLVLGIAVLGILVVLNWLAYENPKRWDLTEDKEYTLAPETIETLKSLPGEVKAEAYFTSNMNTDQAQQLLDQYRFHSDGKFQYEFIDPNQNPVQAEEANITQDGSVVMRMGENSRIVNSVAEQEITGALIHLINPEERVIYFLTGHGERSIDQNEGTSFSLAKRVLESKNYTIKSLNLLAEGQIPADASAVVIAGPQQPPTAEETASLESFLRQDGALVVLSEPALNDENTTTDPLTESLANTWGVRLGQDVVVDLSSSQASLVAVGSQYGAHAITEKLSGLASLFPTARSIGLEAGEIEVTPTALITTIDRAWAEQDLASLAEAGEAGYNEGTDTPGPITLAAAVEKAGNAGRLVVFGDVDFASDDYFQNYANGDLFINAVDWAVGAEELISLTPKETTQRLLVSPQRTTLNLILLGSVFILPGLVLLAGILVWLQRRRRG